MSNKHSYLNTQIGLTTGVHTCIIESPGMWMSKTELDQLVKDLRAIVSALGIQDLEYSIFTGSKEALDRAVITIIYRGKEKVPLAFNAMAYMNCQLKGSPAVVLHLGLTAVNPNEQAKGFTWTLYGLSTALILIKNRFRPIWISSVTQVPAVFGKVAENFGETFPNPKIHQRRTYDHLSLARQIMKNYRSVFGVGTEAEFDEDRFIIQNSYTGGSDHLKKTYEDCTKHRYDVYNELCLKQLDYKRGDDFLQIGKLDLPTIFQYVFRTIPKNRIMIVLAKSALVFFNSMLAPILQWFTTSKQFKELRPR